jgi:hypothetical protein
MKINGYKFGHPVFGDPDYYDFKPVCNIENKIEEDNFIITSDIINCGANEKIIEMIHKNEAKVIAEVFCTHTMFRKVFEQDLQYNITIPLKNLKNKVEVVFLIVANVDLPKFTNQAIKKELRELEFYIEKGEILAYLGEYNFELDIEGTGLDSIIKIRPAESNNIKSVQYIFIEDSVIIELPIKEFEALKQFSENPDYQKLLISSILQTALIHACYKLSDNQYEEKGWSRVLKIHWSRTHDDSEYPSNDEVAEFIEELLSNPTNLLLDTLAEMDNKDKNTEYE